MLKFELSVEEKQMIEENIKLAYWKAHRWSNALSNYNLMDEFVSCCELALIKAVHTYDNTKPNKFATYANVCMDNQIRAYLKSNYKQNLSISSITIKDDEFNDEIYIDKIVIEQEQFYDIEDRLDLQNLLEALPDREYNIIYMYYYVGYNEKEIAEIIKLSQSYISRLKRKGLSTLKTILESKERTCISRNKR